MDDKRVKQVSGYAGVRAADEAVSYVVAVSGGVDSVVLLHILAQSPGFRQVRRPPRLIVAHFDHGIRPDSAADRQFVERLARRYGLAFTYDEGRLGSAASEATARNARYAFLRKVRQASAAQAIVTAHHEDDVFETAVLNLLRGTGRKGLSSLRSTEEIYRPLLRTPKKHIHAYASKHGLEWREDSTNKNTEYLRNYVRLNILSRFDEDARQRLRGLIQSARVRNVEIDSLLARQLELYALGQPISDRLDRQWFIMLPHAVAREIIAAWLRQLGINQFDRVLLEKITLTAKTYAPGKQVDVNGRYIVLVGVDEIVLAARKQ